MKTFRTLVTIAILAILTACNKYKNIEPTVNVSGYAYLHDTLSSQFPVALDSQTVYLNKGEDVSSYLLQTTTDAAGHFSISFVNNEKSILYVHFVKNGTEYRGQKIVNGRNKDSVLLLNVYPVYINGMALNFVDAYNTLVPKLKFRIYTSKVAAAVDSTKYAFIDSQSNQFGQYSQYNINPNKYYVVASDTIAGKRREALDSVTIGTKGVFNKNIIIK